ncbi:aldo/keto reductase [Acetobacteraceae bacterium KSS8]|uniref:Aldo/keto reductase n=1 Tax=Endosaccharibacter trunci TaxID=2812733 RepID=A0ABT1W6D4_9PROT|nr:aldo/keto reductase [Acetobacteraceae bacterium KSS8]
MPNVPTIALNGGGAIPQLGYGVFKVKPEEAERAVGIAIQEGYRSIDTAAIYRNEEGVGRAIAAAEVPRAELFVTTKLWNTDQGTDTALRAFETSLGKLGLDYVDLYLIHWPRPQDDKYVESWRVLERIAAEGRARAIGVSNFTVAHLRRLIDETGTVPAVNQIELHPGLQQNELHEFHRSHGIVTEAWSPLAQGELENPVIGALAEKHGRTPAQVVLRWHMQRGVVAIPKSVTPSRIRENIDVFGFALDEADMRQMAGLDAGKRLGPDPETF